MCVDITETPLRTKVSWTLMTALAPEITLTIAIVEFVTVRHEVKDYNITVAELQPRHRNTASEVPFREPEDQIVQGQEQLSLKWTLVDKFYASMGGFVGEIDRKSEVFPLSKITARVRWGTLKLSPSYPLQIRKNSKADTFSKLIAILQALWFMLQCIERYLRHLPLSNLKLGTFGYVIITLMLYMAWARKPRGVETRITLLSRPKGCLVTDFPKQDPDYSGVASHWKSMLNTILGFMSRLRINSELQADPENAGFIMVIYAVVCTCFGLWHCITWNNYFPSPIEHLLWHVGSLLSIFPTVTFLIAFTFHACCDITGLGYGVGMTLVYIWGVLDLLSHSFLFTEMFLSLHRMPDGVFKTVEWSSYIPHV
ncbi:hypothetical protein CERSUDRAFT_100800 [Gelatoporia subvermispora B]|uniref:Uncharacterized protein n=1 Tax=Ceriporiopsis subvermispora (strain B) TaxID=914234 RepID=M2P6R7_CERS8|nr:hypothetical protein CERSUDRAFT_100800 [Gelatoporia subvermispora B]